jgi:ZIP family zinc transporter
MQAFNTYAILLTLISGLSTGLGGVITAFSGNTSLAKLGHMLSFASGVMLYMSFVDLLPESTRVLGDVKANTSVGGAPKMYVSHESITSSFSSFWE